jgi:two-component system, LuxR family, response regulator FixJ
MSAMTPTPVIGFLEDDASVRDAIGGLLRAQGYETHVFATIEAFRAGFVAGRCDALLLDIRLPDGSGLEAFASAREKDADVSAVFLTGHGDVPLATRAMKAGASDFHEKPVAPSELLASLARAMVATAERRADRALHADATAKLASLTAREREVLTCLIDGLTSKEAARVLGLSPRTVEAHRARLLAKTGCENVAGLIRLATLAGTLTPRRGP